MPSTSYDLAFVDSIVASPTVRLDLHANDAGWQCLADGTEFPPPPLDRVVSQSQMADGDLVPSAAYRNRTITLALELSMELDADAQATKLQALMRELDRASNFLRYRTDTTAPVFFRTLRSGPDSIDWDPFMRRATVSLMAQPFGCGVEEVLSPITVANNPASANGLFFDITSPKGDVETPLYMTVANGVVATGRRRSAFAIRRRGTVASTPLFLQAEAMTMGTNAATSVNAATFSGAGNNSVRITPGTTSMVSRLTMAAHPSSAGTDARGTYRVYMRTKTNTATDVWAMRLRWGGVDDPSTNDTVTLPTDTGPSAPTLKMIDLGLVQIPAGRDPVMRGVSGTEVATEGIYLDVQAQRVSGSGTMDLDYLLFMPADPVDGSMTVLWPETATVTDFVVSGGPSPSVYARNASAQVTSTQHVVIEGTGLMITPGVTNRVFFHRDVGWSNAAVSGGDGVTATTSITPSYFPYYLSPVKPVAT
jgi:hypothetical protein